MFHCLGVWAVGNIGREMGTIWWALGAAYIMYPFRIWFADDSNWLTAMTFVSALAFDHKSKCWRRKPYERKSFLRLVRKQYLLQIILSFFILLNSFLEYLQSYFNV